MMDNSAFISGLDLAEAFYRRAVIPILTEHFPMLVHSAALIGAGSEVLGFDTAMSTDHNWGPRMQLFLADEQMHLAPHISSRLAHQLPRVFMGYSTNYTSPDPENANVQLLAPSTQGPIKHRVEISTARSFFIEYLGADPTANLTPSEWLILEENRLRSVTAGRVFHDGLNVLETYRLRFAFYPRDVWLYILAAEWTKIAQEEAFVGRCGIVNDELGSRLVTSRIVHSIMRLGFLMERSYPPYSKWFGTGFSRLTCSAALSPLLANALAAVTWQERETHLCAAYTQLANLHNSLALTPPLDTATSGFHDRPFRVIHADHFARALMGATVDSAVKELPNMVGSINQFVTSVDVVTYANVRTRLSAAYTPRADGTH